MKNSTLVTSHVDNLDASLEGDFGNGNALKCTFCAIQSTLDISCSSIKGRMLQIKTGEVRRLF